MDKREFLERSRTEMPAVLYGELIGQAGWGRGMMAHIPDHMHQGLVNHIALGAPTGEFLEAVLKGDLFHALRKADDMNLRSLHKYGMFLFNYAPSECFGSPEAVRDWSAKGGLLGDA